MALSLIGPALLLFDFAVLVPLFRPKPPQASAVSGQSLRQFAVRSAIDHRVGRAVFPYSIIPGGAYSIQELKESLASDPVAAQHYEGFRVEAAHMVVADRPRLFYASYRVGANVYWTKRPVHIAAGETLISDGQKLARARCGNQLSEDPKTPTAAQAPKEEEMDTPKITPGEARGGTPNPGTPPSGLAYEVFPPTDVRGFPIVPETPGTTFTTSPPSGVLGLGSLYGAPGLPVFGFGGPMPPPTAPPFVLPSTPSIPVMLPSPGPPVVGTLLPPNFPIFPPSSLPPGTPTYPGTPITPIPPGLFPPAYPPSGFPPTTPTTPFTPVVPETPGTPGTPITPETPKTPVTPFTPLTPTTPLPPDIPVPEPASAGFVIAAGAVGSFLLLRRRRARA